MDVLKKLLNNPAFDHLAENIIGFMDTDVAMETMIESEHLTDEERKVMKKILRKVMVKEAQMRCKKQVTVIFNVLDRFDEDEYVEYYFKMSDETTLYKLYPFFEEALQELKRSESLKSFNQLYDILVWLQPGESQLDDEKWLEKLYNLSKFHKLKYVKGPKGPEDMIEVFERANEDDEFWMHELRDSGGRRYNRNFELSQ